MSERKTTGKCQCGAPVINTSWDVLVQSDNDYWTTHTESDYDDSELVALRAENARLTVRVGLARHLIDFEIMPRYRELFDAAGLGDAEESVVFGLATEFLNLPDSAADEILAVARAGFEYIQARAEYDEAWGEDHTLPPATLAKLDTAVEHLTYAVDDLSPAGRAILERGT